MRRILVKFLALSLFMLPVTATASEFYVGIIIGALSRTGMVLGVKLDDENSLEAHVGGFPHNATYGLTLKHSNKSKEYLMFGYSAILTQGIEGAGHAQGLQVGMGRRFDSINGNWSQALEVIGGPSYDFTRKRWGILGSLGYAATYNELD